MKRTERICVVCHKNYEYCSQGCKGTKIETWRNIYCSENCRSIFNVCSSFVGGNITADEAKIQLESIDIPKSLSEGLQKNLDDINAFSKPKLHSMSSNSEIIISDPVLEQTEVKPKKRRGRPRKRKN